MNKNDLKKMFKPLIKECLSEILLEEGLKSIVGSKEVVKEEIQQKKPVLEEKKENKPQKLNFDKIFNKKAIENNKKLGFDLSNSPFNPFEGTVPEDKKVPTPTKRDIQVGNMINESSNNWTKILNAIDGKKDR